MCEGEAASQMVEVELARGAPAAEKIKEELPMDGSPGILTKRKRKEAAVVGGWVERCRRKEDPVLAGGLYARAASWTF